MVRREQKTYIVSTYCGEIECHLESDRWNVDTAIDYDHDNIMVIGAPDRDAAIRQYRRELHADCELLVELSYGEDPYDGY